MRRIGLCFENSPDNRLIYINIIVFSYKFLHFGRLFVYVLRFYTVENLKNDVLSAFFAAAAFEFYAV